MSSLIDDLDIEQEQMRYLQIEEPETTVVKPKPVILDQEQEQKIIEKIKNSLPEKTVEVKNPVKFSFDTYLDIISTSFMGIMDDLVKFNGDLTTLRDIFTKDDRFVFVSTVIICVALSILLSKK